MLRISQEALELGKEGSSPASAGRPDNRSDTWDSTVIDRSKRMLKRCKADTFLFQADGGAEGGVYKIPVKVLLVRSEPA
jgi:hypothetical protein